MKNKSLILMFFAFCICAITYAKETKLPALIDKNTTVVIGKVIIDYDYNPEFLLKALKHPKSMKVYNQLQVSKRNFSDSTTGYGDPGMYSFENGDYFFTNFSSDYKEYYGTVCTIRKMTYFFFKSNTAVMVIPKFIRFNAPKDAQFVYVGTFHVILDPKTALVTEIKRVDEYDQAKEWLQNQKGADAELVRVELIPIEKKK